jgi:hypothetical protein
VYRVCVPRLWTAVWALLFFLTCFGQRGWAARPDCPCDVCCWLAFTFFLLGECLRTSSPSSLSDECVIDVLFLFVVG